MDDREISRILRAKSAHTFSATPAYKRKAKLKSRYKGRYESELESTLEKVRMLQELIREQR